MTQQYDNTHYNSTFLTLSGSPLLIATHAGTDANYGTAFCTEYFSANKYYCECNLAISAHGRFGFGTSAAVTTTSLGAGDAVSVGMSPGAVVGQVLYNFGTLYANLAAMVGPIFGMAWDLGNGSVWWKDVTANPSSNSGTWYGSSGTAGDPTTNTGGAVLSTLIPGGGPYTPAASVYNTGDVATMKFTSGSWTGTPPTGYVAFDAVAAATCLRSLMGVGCFIGWRAALPLAAAWKVGKAISDNPVVSRRSLLRRPTLWTPRRP